MSCRLQDKRLLLKPLDVAPLRQQFYADVSAWTRRLATGKERVVREAVLRHLIRVMFAWILKEDGAIPYALFEQAFAAATLRNRNSYHKEVLRYLFHERLNIPLDRRNEHPNGLIHELMEATPFLNGSLFHEQDGDDDLSVSADEYWSASDECPGLFTLLSRYHWTTDEHRPGESEQTLDPELLSNMFERLILVIEDEPDDGVRDRQPRGTYYTPADITAEMVKDALAAATRPHAPKRMTSTQLLDLFGDRAAPLPNMSVAEQSRLAARVRALRIFDPAVGSGAFLFGCLAALKMALEKLAPDSADPTLGIILKQLHGQDIHPLAAQIARLRLFIALKAADRGTGRSGPLPNLEARIVCADTLETSADAAWRPDHPGQLDTAAPELVKALVAVAENRQAWMDAHTGEDKAAVLDKDAIRRNNLKLLLQTMSDLASPELRNFAETPLIAQHVSPARTDARLLFYENPWRGFDIVIGNPPYEALSKSMDTARKRALAERKRYRTTNCGDLYTLFCETALALANPQGGVVTMIVPLSIAFGQQQRTLRRVFEERCVTLNLRHYNNRPDTPFNDSPTVRAAENRQRATIVTAIRGSASGLGVCTTGLQRWSPYERHLCIAQRQGVSLPRLGMNVDERIAGQWPRIPTEEVASLVSVALTQAKTVKEYWAGVGIGIAIPKTAYLFLPAIPEHSVSPRSETVFPVADTDMRYLLVAALNGHVAHGWWAIFGDGFHVNLHELASLPIPDAWVSHPQPAIRLGKRLTDAIPECIVEHKQQGRTWRNVDFHTHRPSLIEETDRLYIEALGLPLEPLLTHLRIVRSNRSWNFTAASSRT